MPVMELIFSSYELVLSSLEVVVSASKACSSNSSLPSERLEPDERLCISCF
jgi:hypothetical protein